MLETATTRHLFPNQPQLLQRGEPRGSDHHHLGNRTLIATFHATKRTTAPRTETPELMTRPDAAKPVFFEEIFLGLSHWQSVG